MELLLNKIISFCYKLKNEVVSIFTGNNIEDNKYKIAVAFKGAFFAAIICFTHFLINDHGCPDTLNEAFLNGYISYGWSVSLGRWFTVYANRLTSYIVIPILFVMANTACQAISTIILTNLFNIKEKYMIFLIAFLLTSSPAVVYQHLYVYLSFCYGIAVLGAALFAHFSLSRKGIISFVIATASLCLSLASYQSYIGFAAGIVAMYIIYLALKNKLANFIIIIIIRSIISAIISVGIYWALMKIMLKRFVVDLAGYGGASSISIVNSLNNLPTSIKNAYKGFYQYFFTDKILLIFVTSFVCLLLIHIFKHLKNKKFISAIIMLIFGLLLPLALNLICIIAPSRDLYTVMTEQLQLIIPFTFVLLINFNYTDITKKLLNYFVIFISAILCLNLSVNAFATYNYVNLSYKYVNTVTSAAINRVYNLDGYEESLPILLMGWPDESDLHKNNITANRSYYEGSGVLWHAKVDRQIWQRYLYSYFGIWSEYDYMEYSKIQESDEVKSMPDFPHKDSIKIIDGKVIIKFSDIK